MTFRFFSLIDSFFFFIQLMTSSEFVFSNNHHPRLSNAPRFNLPVPSNVNGTDDLRRSASCATTPTSTSPANFFTPLSVPQTRFPQPNMFAFPRYPTPRAPALTRKPIHFKPPEQDILDKSFFRTFNMEQKEENSETISTASKILKREKLKFLYCL